jgi:hypothetical protein
LDDKLFPSGSGCKEYHARLKIEEYDALYARSNRIKSNASYASPSKKKNK